MENFIAELLNNLFRFSSFNLGNDILPELTKTASTALPGAIGVIETMGFLFLAMWAVIDCMDAISMDSVSTDVLQKKFVFIMVGILLVANSQVFVSKVPVFCSTLSTQVSNAANEDLTTNSKGDTEAAKQYKSLVGEIKNMPFWSKIPAYLAEFQYNMFLTVILILFWIVAQICGVLLLAMKLGVAIEMCIRGLFMPIGLSDISRGINGNCVRYIRVYIASGFQLVVITGIGKIAAALGNKIADLMTVDSGVLKITNAGTLVSVCILVVAIYVVAVISAGKASGIARDVFGV